MQNLLFHINVSDLLLFIVAALYTFRIIYWARAKGVNVPLAILMTVVATVICTWLGFRYDVELQHIFPQLVTQIIGVLLGPSIVYVILRQMDTRAGAPGVKYLKINFDCPECGTALSIDRSRRGLTIDCTNCGEIVRVPNDEAGKPQQRLKPRGNPDDVVVVQSFPTEHLALIAQSLLEEAGIGATVASNSAGSTLTFLPENQDADLKITLADWDRAQSILNADEDLP